MHTAPVQLAHSQTKPPLNRLNRPVMATLHMYVPMLHPYTFTAAPPMTDSSGKMYCIIMHAATTSKACCPHYDSQNQTQVPVHVRGGRCPRCCGHWLQLLRDATLKRRTSLASPDYLCRNNICLLSRLGTKPLNKHSSVTYASLALLNSTKPYPIFLPLIRL